MLTCAPRWRRYRISRPVGDPTDPEVLDTLASVAEAAGKANKMAGIFCANGLMAANMFDQGYNFCAVSNDIDFMLASAVTHANVARGGGGRGGRSGGGGSGGSGGAVEQDERAKEMPKQVSRASSTNCAHTNGNSINSHSTNTSTSTSTDDHDHSDTYTSPFVLAGSAGSVRTANELVELRNRLAEEREKYNRETDVDVPVREYAHQSTHLNVKGRWGVNPTLLELEAMPNLKTPVCSAVLTCCRADVLTC